MKNFMFVFVIAALSAPAISAQTQAPNVIDDEVRGMECEDDQIVVCANWVTTDGVTELVLSHATETGDYDRVRCPSGFAPKCVNMEKVKTLCEGRGSRFHWNAQRQRCDYWEPRPPTPPAPPTPPTTTPPSPPAPPVQPGPTLACPDCTIECTAEDLRAILDGVTFIEGKIDEGAAVVLTPKEIRALLAEAESLREQANECRNEALSERATTLIAALDMDPDYTDEFNLVHQHLDTLDLTVDTDENWCTASFGGVLTCIVLPTVAAGAAIFLGVYYGTEWSATQE